MPGPITTHVRSRKIMLGGVIISVVGLFVSLGSSIAEPIMTLSGVHPDAWDFVVVRAVRSIGAAITILGITIGVAGYLYRSLGRTY